ncbi:16S rRNA (uracil(1498)-N(3))-methyltransferase [Phormidium sp. CLA17]|uniref:16S rRNA (uracil(1498)-N(3))-methyltransferase n=1 Tax=Leptolyngbya sp. Cla-17 TaxID=2803751 RepID=UPI0014916F65|nr:16S rRNA (uracil(1498)-N(3))-methyltransferase [Leptolyngbya sp. Cla-17]MBM0743132.1 16S rRNA (uracil(1498)-N(3))-methyltransferase [Leptolyngbya sp. Cla-17]
MLQRIVIDPCQICLKAIALSKDQQHYLGRVLRLQAGDRFIAMDGQGKSWLAHLIALDGQLQAEIVESVQTQTELPVCVTLVMALPKGNGFDDVVRQATELGVACIVPVLSDRALLNPSSQKCDRWRRIAQEAAEQSERQCVPIVQDPIPFTQSLTHLTPAFNYLCVTRRTVPHLLNCLSPDSNPQSQTPPITLAIGCEGGWTDAEVDQAIAAGYQPVSLGSRILRAVTAPIVALSLIAAVYERNGDRESFS